MGTMSVMNKEGDTLTVWDPTKEDEVAIAAMEFDAARAQGYMAYSLEGADGGTLLRDFEPAAERIVLAAPLVGG